MHLPPPGVTLSAMKWFWRIASLLFVALTFVVLVPIPWSDVRWGTVPEWVAALALGSILAAVWRVALAGSRDGRPAHEEQLSRRWDH
jgi:hypothetical protein